MATLQRRLAAPALKLTFDAYLDTSANNAPTKTNREVFEDLILDASSNSYAGFLSAISAVLEGPNGEYKMPTSGSSALPTNHRVIIVGSDGTVFFDSSKKTNKPQSVGVVSTTDGKPLIGDNHMTRPEIMVAALNQSGVGTSTRLSNTTKKMSQYFTYRTGPSQEEPKGFIRYSIEDAVAQA
jgi:hypothetical protein